MQAELRNGKHQGHGAKPGNNGSKEQLFLLGLLSCQMG